MTKQQHPVAVLTRDEKQSLEVAETTIRKGLASFMEVGMALKTIRTEKLYRGEFPNFEDYCQEKWSISKRYANYQIEAATVATKVTGNNCSQSPLNEAQARELVKAGESATKVFKEAAKRAEKEEVPVTAKLIAEVRDEIVPPKPKAHANGHASTPPPLPGAPDDDPPFEEPPPSRVPGEDDDETPSDLADIEQWDGAKINQLIKAVSYLENKVVGADAAITLRICRLFPHHGLPLKRWNEELASKTRDLTRFRRRLETAKKAAKK